VSSFNPLLGRTWSRGRCWAVIRLSHCPAQSRHVLHGKVDGLDNEEQHGQSRFSAPHSQTAEWAIYPICESRSGNVRHQCWGG